jgi:diadenosine tetraphosphate (Ap4A) HIT family hydrolase
VSLGSSIRSFYLNFLGYARRAPSADLRQRAGMSLERSTMPRAALLGFSFLSDCGTCKSIALETASGGCIHRTEHWFVDHCIGPLGVGTLIIKPNRHVVHVSDLQAAEAAELGVVLQQAAAVVTALATRAGVRHAVVAHARRARTHSLRRSTGDSGANGRARRAPRRPAPGPDVRSQDQPGSGRGSGFRGSRTRGVAVVAALSRSDRASPGT